MTLATAPTWDQLRALAAARAMTLGLPTAADEDWRYVDCARIADPAATAPDARCRVVGDLPPGVEIHDLLSTASDSWSARWAAHVAITRDVTTCWSHSGLRQAMHLRITRPVTSLIELHLSGHGGLRLVIECAAHASADVRIHLQAPLGSRLDVGVDIDVAAHARLRCGELVEGPGQLFRHTQCRLDHAAEVELASVTAGGRLVRLRTEAVLGASNANLVLAGATRLAGETQAHHVVRVTHLVGNTTSEQRFLAIAGDRSATSFDGLVTIAAKADGSAARQLSRSLLLSRTARADARPQLDIHADDVSASHGATVGQPNEDQLFYLRSRGFTSDEALQLLIAGFLADAVAQLPHSHAAAAALLGVTVPSV